MADETAALDDGWLRVSHTPGLHVVADEQHTRVPAGRLRVEVRLAVEVTGSLVGGRLTITTASRAGRLLTVLVAVEAGYEVVAESAVHGRERTFTLEIAPAGTRRLVVVEHAPGLSHEKLAAVLAAPDDFLAPAPVRPSLTDHADGAPALPSAAPEIAWEAEMRAAAPGPPAESAPSALAEVGANMPHEVHVDDTVPVEVLLSRERVQVFAGTSHDEHVVVMDPDRPLDVVLLRRGFDLDDRELPHETGRRSLSLPPKGEPAVRVLFWLRAAHGGEGEVQVVVRQDHPLPLATLRLTATVLPRTGLTVDRASAEARLEARAPVQSAPFAGSVTPFVNPQSLVIDENVVGVVSELSFDLCLPDFRCRFTHVVDDKSAVLTRVFTALDTAWRDFEPMADPVARSVALHERLRRLGTQLAVDVLPPELLSHLRDHLEDICELAVITSGETDIPWELVHVWAPGAADDPEGRGFLGRAGLVRWVYNTSHPTNLSVRTGSAHYLIPQYVDPALFLEEAQLEPTYLQAFGATAIDPPDAAGIARLLTSGQVDLLHFAGHGLSNDDGVPPVRDMALGAYRLGAATVAGSDRSRIAFSLENLRRSLPNSPPLRFGEPGPLVFLNACRIGQAPSTRSEAGGFARPSCAGALVPSSAACGRSVTSRRGSSWRRSTRPSTAATPSRGRRSRAGAPPATPATSRGCRTPSTPTPTRGSPTAHRRPRKPTPPRKAAP